MTLDLIPKWPRKSDIAVFNFKNGDFSKVRGLLKRKPKSTARKVKSLPKSWQLFKDHYNTVSNNMSTTDQKKATHLSREVAIGPNGSIQKTTIREVTS